MKIIIIVYTVKYIFYHNDEYHKCYHNNEYIYIYIYIFIYI